MSSFSGVPFVLFLLRFRLYAFTEAAALRSSICMRPDSHACFDHGLDSGFFKSALCETSINQNQLPEKFLKKNLNACRPPEHPPVKGENVKTFR